MVTENVGRVLSVVFVVGLLALAFIGLAYIPDKIMDERDEVREDWMRPDIKATPEQVKGVLEAIEENKIRKEENYGL